MFNFTIKWIGNKDEMHSTNHLYSLGSPTILDDVFEKIQTLQFQIQTPDSYWNLGTEDLNKILMSLISNIAFFVDANYIPNNLKNVQDTVTKQYEIFKSILLLSSAQHSKLQLQQLLLLCCGSRPKICNREYCIF